MLLYAVQNFDTLENFFNWTFVYIYKNRKYWGAEIGRMYKIKFHLISFVIGKMKSENTELTKCGIWYLLGILLIISFTLWIYSSISIPVQFQKDFVGPTDRSNQFLT